MLLEAEAILEPTLDPAGDASIPSVWEIGEAPGAASGEAPGAASGEAPGAASGEGAEPGVPAEALSSAPAWLRDALEAKDLPGSPTHDLPAFGDDDEKTEPGVHLEELEAAAIPQGLATTNEPEPAPLGPLELGGGPTETPAPLGTRDGTPTVVLPAIDLSQVRTDEPPRRAGAPAEEPADQTSIFSFPQELQDDGGLLHKASDPQVVHGVSGPTMVPMERSGTPPTAVGGPTFAPSGDDAPTNDTEVSQIEGSAWLDVRSGPRRGDSVPIGSQLTVGQSDLCGMSLSHDTSLSASHCTVQRTPTGFLIRDMDTTTGTFVNGERIEQRELQGGETIMVGHTVLQFRRDAR